MKMAAVIAGRSSEYDRNFKWNQSFKSGKFSPTGEQIRDAAGKESFKQFVTQEPPLQRKKRVDHLRDSAVLTDLPTPTEDSYLLAGKKSEKFAPAVAYPNHAKQLRRSRQHLQEKQQQYQYQPLNNYVPTKVEEEPVKTPDAPREVRRQLTIPERKEERTGGTLVNGYSKDHRLAEASASTKELEDKLLMAREQARRMERDAIVVRKQRSRSRSQDKEVRGSYAKKDYSKGARKHAKVTDYHGKPQNEILVKPSQHRRRHHSQDVSVQAEEPKQYRNITAAALDDDYAKKYELGIAPNRAPKPTAVTEYQRQFHPVAPKEKSPLKEKAREIVHSSHMAVIPKTTKVPQYSEYQREFQLKPQKVSRGLQPAGVRYRSKSAPRERPEKIPTVAVEGKEYRPHQSLNPQRMSFPLGHHTRPQSEYKRAFKSVPDWFSEVLELRKRAQIYKQRSYGSHFSREHLGQVYGGGVDAWDNRTESSRAYSDDGINYPAAANRPSTAPPRRRNESSDEFSGRGYESDDEAEKKPRTRAVDRESRKEELLVRDERGRPITHSPPRLPITDEKGRQTTPRIRNSRYQRHHFDKTTPNYGAILVGEPVPYDTQKVQEDNERASQHSNSVKAHGVRVPVTRLLRESENLLRDRPASSDPKGRTFQRVAGKPTTDPFPLIDDTASHDASLQLEDMELTPRPRSPTPQEGLEHYRRGIDDSRSEGSSYRARRGEPIVRSKAPVDDADFSDGFFSDTASLVSSTTVSLASDTLERARRRKDQFWGRQ